MEHEYRVLSHIQENEITTQRNISKRTGLSLGAVNLLIKKMARKGLVKVEKLNARTVRYILTPRGMQEKARLTYRYISQSYRQLLKINTALDSIIAENNLKHEADRVILYGPSDEIREILAQYFTVNNIVYEHLEADQPDQAIAEASLVITWREEEEMKLESRPQAVNIMKLV